MKNSNNQTQEKKNGPLHVLPILPRPPWNLALTSPCLGGRLHTHAWCNTRTTMIQAFLSNQGRRPAGPGTEPMTSLEGMSHLKNEKNQGNQAHTVSG